MAPRMIEAVDAIRRVCGEANIDAMPALTMAFMSIDDAYRFLEALKREFAALDPIRDVEKKFISHIEIKGIKLKIVVEITE